MLAVDMTEMSKICSELEYSVVSIKRKGCNKRTGGAKFFLVHTKRTRWCKNFF